MRKREIPVLNTKCEEAGSERAKKRAEIAFPPKLCGSGDCSASLCHISLRRSSQRLAGCVWPGLTLGGGVWVPGPEPSGLQPPSQAGRPALPHTSLASHWGQVREPLGRGASTSRVAPFKPLGGGGGDPSRLQLSGKRAEDRGREVERGEERGTSEERRWMTRGCRCELSWETNVQRLCGVKRRCWVEAGSSALHVWKQQRPKVFVVVVSFSDSLWLTYKDYKSGYIRVQILCSSKQFVR